MAPESVAMVAAPGQLSSMVAAIDVAGVTAIRMPGEDPSPSLCPGVSRPTTQTPPGWVETHRWPLPDATLDVRVSGFADTEAPGSVLAGAHDAYNACGTTSGQGTDVQRTVHPFVSLAGSEGLTLTSTLLDDSGQPVGASTTLAVATGNLLVELRLTGSEESMSQIEADLALILDDLEAEFS